MHNSCIRRRCNPAEIKPQLAVPLNLSYCAQTDYSGLQVSVFFLSANSVKCATTVLFLSVGRCEANYSTGLLPEQSALTTELESQFLLH